MIVFVLALIIFLLILLMQASGIVLYISLFLLDKAVLFFYVLNLMHKHFSTKFSSGNAIWFWNITFSIIAVLIYTFIFENIRYKFPKIGKLLNFIISFISSYFVYFFISYVLVNGGLNNNYYLQLLNNTTANIIVNWIIVLLISCVIFYKRDYAYNNTDYGEYIVIFKHD